MMQSSKREMQRGYISVQIDPPSSIDVASSDSTIPSRRAKELTNVYFQNKSIASNGSRKGTPISTEANYASPFADTFFYLSEIYGIYKSTIALIQIVHIPSGTTGILRAPTGIALDATPYTRIAKYTNTFILYGDTASVTPQILYFDTASWLWKVRDLGIIPPSLKTATLTTPTTIATKRYRYGVDLIYVENGIVVRSSGVSRRMSDGTMFDTVDLSATNNVSITIDPPTAPANTWTHVRLWRCKNLLEVDGQVQGVESALYTIFTKTQAEIISAGYVFPLSVLNDYRLPYGGTYFDPGVTTPEVLDLSPLRGFSVYASTSTRRLVASGMPSDISGIYFSAATYASRYAEQYSPADRTSSAEEMGTPLQIGAISDDVVIVGTRGVFRVPNSDLDSTIVPVGRVGSIDSHLSVSIISDFGIVCRLSDKTLRFMDLNYRWSTSYGKGGGGLPLEWPTPHLIVLWSRGTLSIANRGDTGYYHLGLDEGWTYREIGQIVGIWEAGEAEISALVKQDSPSVTGEIRTPFVAGTAALVSAISLGPFQPANLGDGLMEFLEFRIEGAFLDADISVTIDGTPLVAIDGADAPSTTRTHTYRMADQTPLKTRVFAQRFFVRIVSVVGKAFVFDGFTLRAIVQQGAASPSRFTASAEQINLAQQQALLSGIVQRFTRLNTLSDFYGSGDIS